MWGILALIAAVLLITGSIHGPKKIDETTQGAADPNKTFTNANRVSASYCPNPASAFAHGAQRKAGTSQKTRKVGNTIHKKIGKTFVKSLTGIHTAKSTF